MKLSQVLKDWPEKKFFMIAEPTYVNHFGSKPTKENYAYNNAINACDREIDREALAKAIYVEVETWDNLPQPVKELYFKTADFVISTMPTWLKVSEK